MSVKSRTNKSYSTWKINMCVKFESHSKNRACASFQLRHTHTCKKPAIKYYYVRTKFIVTTITSFACDVAVRGAHSCWVYFSYACVFGGGGCRGRVGEGSAPRQRQSGRAHLRTRCFVSIGFFFVLLASVFIVLLYVTIISHNFVFIVLF